MAVAGWDRFRDRFAGYENNYTVIGGFACEILLRSEQRAFRATKDIDMIILMEDRFQEFGHIFWSFIKKAAISAVGDKARICIIIALLNRIPDIPHK